MQRSLWTWLAPVPKRTSLHCFLGLQFKWEKLISWFGVCALSTRHSLDQSHSVLCFDPHFHTSSCMARSSTHEFPQTAMMGINKAKEKNNFHASVCMPCLFLRGEGAPACCFSALCHPVGGAPAVKSVTDNYFVFLEITVTCVEEPGQEMPKLLH